MKNAAGSGESRYHERGFSLIEMIVAVTLVALMAVGLWAVLRISVRSWSRGTEYIDTSQRHRSVLDLVKKQMASIYGLVVPADPQAGGVVYPLFSGAPTSIQFISLNSLRFQDNPGLTMVSYDVIQGRQGDYTLVEREQQYLGMDPGRESPFDRKDQVVTTVFEDLQSFTFEYFDPGASDRASRWVKEWNARELGRLPAAISMTMIAQDSRGGLLNRQMVIPVLAEPYDPRLSFVNPFDPRPRRLNETDPRFIR